jgi:hypothetical protein
VQYLGGVTCCLDAGSASCLPAQITTFAESGNPEHGVLVIENVDLHWCVALRVAFGISLP